MVQAKLAGRKFQTRRIIKESWNGCLTNGGPHPCPNDPVVIHPGENLGEFDGVEMIVDYPQVRAFFHCSNLDSEAKCPYGAIGDILWAREACHWDGDTKWTDLAPIGNWWYKADCPEGYSPKWRPSIHMPKEAARIWEKITDIRVERLNSIDDGDAIAEGLAVISKDQGRTYKYGIPDKDGLPGNIDYGWPWTKWDIDPKKAYATLWESINGPGSWSDDPWVWVITTKILSTTGRPADL